MDISRSHNRTSTFATCVAAASDYGMTHAEAQAVVDHQVSVIKQDWDDAADAVGMTRVERSALFGRSILNPYAFRT